MGFFLGLLILNFDFCLILKVERREKKAESFTATGEIVSHSQIVEVRIFFHGLYDQYNPICELQ